MFDIQSVARSGGAANIAMSPGNVISAKFSQDESEVVLELTDSSVVSRDAK